MTREERARHALAAVVDTAGRKTYARLVRLSVDNRDRFGGQEVIAAMLAFADAEAAAMRERAAECAEEMQQTRNAARLNALGRKQKGEARDHETMAMAAAQIKRAIRALPATGEE